ncbi:MAG: nucleotidyl transferase AbiEii/AbiGii toxin family protein [Ruminiclostridium sp.]|nr:nucleotidyl transferase AbiEii/AbiGii toxin family protein [Ruminiclostridium sp.]
MFEDKLINKKVCFQRGTLEARMQINGIKNLGRMELFLWDLEFFLQIQNILKERVVLKGGAAAQFYLPIEYQRSSVDIDIIFYGSKEEIDDTLSKLEELFGADDVYFKFKQHIPVSPKTNLPLYTYYVTVPSICTENELRGMRFNRQTIKIEFFVQSYAVVLARMLGSNIFAVESDMEYQILPINMLLADKLTTLGPKTVGIKDVRTDEQLKQIFDIHSLISFNLDHIDLGKVRPEYFERAKVEADIRNIEYNEKTIINDVLTQLKRLSRIDIVSDKEVTKYINDFQGLYLGNKSNKSPAHWAIASEQLRFIYKLIINGRSLKNYMLALELDKLLEFGSETGIAKGKKINEFKEILLKEYGHLTDIDVKILKGKSLKRVFWIIVDVDNIDQLEYFVNDKIV